MATYYWVGGTGNWDSSTTTNWASTSGGSGGAGVPVNTDNIVFDSNSGSGSVTVNYGSCANLTATGSSLTFTSFGTAYIYGNIVFGTSTTWNLNTYVYLEGGVTQTLTSGGATIKFPFIVRRGSTASLVDEMVNTGAVQLSDVNDSTAGSLNLNNNNLTCSSFSFNSNGGTTGVRTLTSGTGIITITGSGTCFTANSDTSYITYADQPTIYFTYSGSSSRTISLASYAYTNPPKMYFTGGTGSLSFSGSGSSTTYGLINFTGFNGSLTSMSGTVKSNLTYDAGMTSTATGTITLDSTSTLTTGGISLTNPFTFNNASATFTVSGNLTTTKAVTLTAGTLSFGNNNLTALSFSTGTSGTRSVTFGSGSIELTGTGTVWSMSSTVTFTKGSANILLSDTSTTSRTFAGGGKTYNKLTIGGSTGTSTTSITGSNTFSELASTKTVAHTITFSSGTTTTVAAWTITGTSGNVVTLSPSSTTNWTLTKTGGGTVNTDYMSISRSTATPSSTWYATNSTDGGNNSGWTITAPPSVVSSNFFMLF